MRSRDLCHFDKVNAVVCDPGSYTFRVGLARHREPNVEIATTVGVPAGALDPGFRPDGRISYSASAQYDVDVTSLCVPREGVDMVTYMDGAVIDDWDLFEKVFDYAYANHVRSDPRDHPLMFTERPLKMGVMREELAELMFEKYDVPSMCLLPDAVLATFALRRFHDTAVIVDSGATHTSVVPVHAGSVIADCVQVNPLGGYFVSSRCRQFLDMSRIDIIPQYMIAKTCPVKAKEKPIWTMKTELPKVTESWHNYMCDLVVDDFKRSVLQISKRPLNGRSTKTYPTHHYTFPNGYNQEFGKERFEITESLFGPNPFTVGSPLSLGHMVITCIKMCDEDLRSTLFKNIIVIGGNSMFKGFRDRLYKDVCVYKPHKTPIKIMSPHRPIYGQYSAWLGGSLIANDETAENLWFSSYEYQEYGKSYIRYKCPR